MSTDLYRFFHSFHTLNSVKLSIEEHLLTIPKNDEKIEFITNCIQYHQIHNFKTDAEVVLAKTSMSINQNEINSIDDYLPILEYLQELKISFIKEEKERNAVSFTCTESYIERLHELYSLLKEDRIGFICPKTKMIDFFKIFLNVPKEVIHTPIVWFGNQRDLIRVFDNLINKGVILKPSNYAKALTICFCKDSQGKPFKYSFEKAIEKVNDGSTRNEKKLEEIFSLF